MFGFPFFEYTIRTPFTTAVDDLNVTLPHFLAVCRRAKTHPCCERVGVVAVSAGSCRTASLGRNAWFVRPWRQPLAGPRRPRRGRGEQCSDGRVPPLGIVRRSVLTNLDEAGGRHNGPRRIVVSPLADQATTVH